MNVHRVKASAAHPTQPFADEISGSVEGEVPFSCSMLSSD